MDAYCENELQTCFDYFHKNPRYSDAA
jgi:hypothetical protein